MTEVLSSIVDNRGRSCPTQATGFPLIATNCIKNDRLYPTFENVRYISDATKETWFRGHPRAGDVLFVCKGSPGRVALTPDPVPFAIAQDMVALRANPQVIDGRFLLYLLRSPQVQNAIGNLHVGTMIPHFKKADFPKLRFSIPDDLAEQRRIAGVLGALDDLIEVNRRLVRDLDASVRLLGLDAMARAQDRPPVPLTDIADVAKGYSYKSSELVPGDGWLVNLKNIGRSGTFEARGFKPLTATVKPHQIVDNGDVLVAQTDLTQDREVIARPVRVRKGTLEGRLVASLDLAIVRPKAPHTNESTFAILNTEDFRSHALGYCNGTTVLHMGARALPDYAAPSLTQSEIEALTARVRPLREAADALNLEISDLEATRDELLPLLMSGRVRVSEGAAP